MASPSCALYLKEMVETDMYQLLSNTMKVFLSITLVVLGLTTYQNAFAASPFLAFSDLISGPDTGIGDGNGSGVIVTVWGQNLGSSKASTSTITFTDSTGTERNAAHIYYWKNSDGVIPSGPANLYASHKMQEIAFSIPDSAAGAGTIQVRVNGDVSNSLPFNVRSGNIYHVKSTGSDSATGSFSSPWKTIGKATATAPAGSTTYVYDVNTGNATATRGIYWNNASQTSSISAQFSIIPYPGYQPKVTGARGVAAYNTAGFVVSKFDIYSSNYSAVDANDQPSGTEIWFDTPFGIETNANGRAVANRIGDLPGGCSTGASGAIYGNADFYDKVSNFKIFGNEIYEYGCAGTGKLHHTTYMSIRSAPENLQVDPWEFGYNYLHDNHAKFGIHQFDQNEGCGDTTGPILIHDNVIVNQASAGISVGGQCDWSMDFYIENNVLINTGLAADWDGIDVNTSNAPEIGAINIRDSGLLGTMYIRNNLIYKWATQGIPSQADGCLSFYGSEDNVTVIWDNNICYTELDLPFIGNVDQSEQLLDNVTGSNNVFYYKGGSAIKAISPTWDSKSLLVDPLISITGAIVSLDFNSPLVGKAAAVISPRDIYGFLREPSAEIGPIEYSKASNPPSSLSIE